MTDHVGQQLGNYRLTRLLGKGGFAQVYLGEHIYLKTQAAIKVLQVEIDDDEREDFLEEARTIAHLVHPHIVRVLDFGIEGTTPFLVMDYAPNGTLRQHYPKGSQLPVETIVPYVKHIASALQYAHQQNIIHRDVKPGNMLLGREDTVLLSDFGIALVAHDTNSQITEQNVIGSIAYMAPEQIHGKPRPASDQYSLGIAVYEWLCGERPFQGSYTEIVSQQMMAPPPSLRKKVPGLSPDVEEAVMVALSKDPKERFASVTAFAHALEQATMKPSQGAIRPQSTPQHVLRPVEPQTNVITPPTPVARSSTQTPPITQSSRTTGPAMYTNVNTQQGFMMAPPIEKQPPASKERNKAKKIRGFNSKQAAAMLGGAALFGGLIMLAQYTSQFTDVKLIANITLAFIISCLANITLPFFAALFGPLVGVFTGLVGVFIADYGGSYILTPAQHTAIHSWHWYFGAALIGLFVGLIVRGTLGRRKSTATILVVDIIAAFGVALGFARFLGGNELISAIALTILLLHIFLVSYNTTKMSARAS